MIACCLLVVTGEKNRPKNISIEMFSASFVAIFNIEGHFFKKIDGSPVYNMLQGFCRTMAHEIVHVFQFLIAPTYYSKPGSVKNNGAHDGIFAAFSRTIYGHIMGATNVSVIELTSDDVLANDLLFDKDNKHTQKYKKIKVV